MEQYCCMSKREQQKASSSAGRNESQNPSAPAPRDQPSHTSQAAHQGLQPHCLEVTNVRLSSITGCALSFWPAKLASTGVREAQLWAVISGNVSQSLFVGRDFGQPLCMKTKRGLLSRQRETREPTV